MTDSRAKAKNYSALVIGGTGAVGSALVAALLESDACAEVLAVVRREVELHPNHPARAKLRVLRLDYETLEDQIPKVAASCTRAFSTMGIGQPRKASPELVRKVEVEYTGAFARGAVAAGAEHLSLLSSVGANAASRNRYIRVKGESEQAFLDAGARRTSVFRPSLLVTDDIRYGLQDRISQAVVPMISGLFPSRYHEIHVRDLGRAMAINGERAGSGTEWLYYADFQQLLSD